MNLTHWIAHLFGANTGRVVSGSDQNGVWVGFKCDGCGKTLGKHYVDRVIDQDMKAGDGKGGA